MALSRGSKIFAVVMVALVAGLVYGAVAGVEQLGQMALPEPVEPGNPVEFVIEPGQSGQSIANDLEEQGVVRSGPFLDEVTERGIAARLSPGNYSLETGMDPDEVADVLEAGPQVLRVTVPEGLRVDETLVRLEEQTPHSVADYRDLLELYLFDPGNSNLEVPGWVPAPGDLPDGIRAFEGLLWPATYEFELDATAQQVLQRLLSQAGTVMSQVTEADVRAARQAGISRYGALKIASLIEREARLAEDRPLIAAVIRNRLDEGMRLQIDAATDYLESLQMDPESSPYNLYEVNGLPPTPIAGARPQALQVAFSPPQDVTFRFYVLDDACDGSHVFADTLEEHEVNVQAYRAVGECE